MKRGFIVLFSLLLLFCLAACGNRAPEAKTPDPNAEKETETQSMELPEIEKGDMLKTEEPDSREESLEKIGDHTQEISGKEETMNTIRLLIGEEELSVRWEDNESVDALRELVGEQPLRVQMSMYGGFEQVGTLGTDLPRNDVQTTTGAGDIVLYSGNQIVIFYGSNSWAYTRLGRVADMSADKLSELLGNGDVTITLSE